MLALLSLAHAACTLVIDAPAAQEQLLSAPTFRWTTDCPRARVQIRPDGGSVVLTSPDLTGTSWTPTQQEWDALPVGKYRFRVSTGHSDLATQVFWKDADDDHDGVSVLRGDCDDLDDTRFPGATESCNGLDDDCNGTIDEGALGGWAVSTSGTRDLTADLLAGTALAPASITLVDEDLHLCPGSYVATLTAQGITSLHGDATLDGADQHLLTLLPGADVQVSGLTLTNASRAVECVDGTLTLDAVTVRDSDGSDGALYAGNCLVDIVGSTFENNHSLFGGGAVTLRDGSVLTVTDSSFVGNTADGSGGALEIVSSSLTSTRTDFTDSAAGAGGSAAYLTGTGASFDMVDTTFDDPAYDTLLLWDGLTLRDYIAGGVGNDRCTESTCGTPSVSTLTIAQWGPSGRGLGCPLYVTSNLEEVAFYVRLASPGDICTCTPSVEIINLGAEVFGPTQVVDFTQTRVFMTLDLPLRYGDYITRKTGCTCTMGGLESGSGTIANANFCAVNGDIVSFEDTVRTLR